MPEIHSIVLRMILAGVCVAFLFLFINPLFLGIRNLGVFAGAGISLAGACFFIFNPLISAWIRNIWQNDAGRIVVCIVTGILCFCCILAVVISGMMIGAANKSPKSDEPVVILGCKVRGTQPSLMLARRLDAAIVYLKDHPDVPVIVCGGQGADEQMTEAQCMEEYLITHGIPKERIYQENRSTSTRENLLFAIDILDEQEWEHSVTVVTDGFHQLRASMIASDLKLHTSAVSARTPWFLTPAYWVREWFGVCYQVILG